MKKKMSKSSMSGMKAMLNSPAGKKAYAKGEKMETMKDKMKEMRRGGGM